MGQTAAEGGLIIIYKRCRQMNSFPKKGPEVSH